MKGKGIKGYRKKVLWGVAALFLLLVPLIVTNPYQQSILVFVGIYALAATGLGMLTGYAGQVSIGQSAFYGIGAYTSALVSLRLGVSAWLGLLSGAVLTGIVAYILGKPFLRIRGFYLALVTIGFAMLVHNLMARMDFITGGHDGIAGIPHFSIGGFVLDKDFHYYYLLLIVLTIAILFYHNLVKSKIGRRMRAVDLFTGGSEMAAKALGVDIGKLKTQVFVICCVYAAVAGSIFAHYMGHIHPEPFSPHFSILFLIMIMLGGSRSIWGGLVGAIFYIVIKELLTFLVGGAVGWELVIYALIFLAILIFLPHGLVTLPFKLKERLGRVNLS